MKFIWPTVGIINPAFQSTNGRLFAGTTPVLSFGNGTSAWVRIFNPHHSKINLFLSFFNITNISDNPYLAEFFLNPEPPGAAMISSDVGNLNLGSSNVPKGIIQFNPSVKGKPTGGVRIASRRISRDTTLTGFRVDGRLIIAPETSLLFFLTSEAPVKAELSFQWFEDDNIFC